LTLTMFKLESFSHPAATVEIAEVSFCRDDVDQAYADGYAAGKSEAYESQAEELARHLSELSQTLAQDDSRRAVLRSEAVATLAPVLSQILDLVVPAGQSRRLEETLNAELIRLASQAPSLRVRIACGPGLRTMVERCLSENGLSGLVIDDIPAAKVNIMLEGGRIEISPEQVAQNLAVLIADIKEEAAEWTH
jgi:hypothetical protein